MTNWRQKVFMMTIYDAFTVLRCFHTQQNYFIVATMAVPNFQSPKIVLSEHTFHNSITQEVGPSVKKLIHMSSFVYFQVQWMDHKNDFE